MRHRLTHLLAGAYAIACLALCAQAIYANRRGDISAVITLGAVAILLGCAIAHHTWHADTLTSALLRLERASRPPGPQAAAVADEIALGMQALAESCCLPAALTAGTEHDPEHCTRKDQTT